MTTNWQESYEQETGKSPCVNEQGGGSYTDEYVAWLEVKLEESALRESLLGKAVTNFRLRAEAEIAGISPPREEVE